MRVLAVDPGLRSGLAWWNGGEALEFCATVCDPMPTILRVQNSIELIDALVVESYTITAATAQKSQQHWSLELIGAMRWLAWEHDVEFVLQAPSAAKSFMPDQRLRDLGWWVSGKEDHARDAARHLGLYLAKARQIQVPPLRLDIETNLLGGK